MKQIIPFTKDITFKSKIGELTSISLDNDLTLKGEDIITGNFYISGTYKMMDTVLNPEKYSYKIPVEISISDEYDTYDCTIDIDDFEYEVVGDDTLSIKITVVIDNLVKKEKIELLEVDEERNGEKKDLDDLLNDTDEKVKENSEREAITESKEEIKNEVSEDLDKKDIDKEEDNDMKKDENEINRNSNASFLEKSKDIKNEEDTYLTYRVYIVKEEDTVNSIKDKYNVSEEELSSYNDISNLCSGMKLVIPSND